MFDAMNAFREKLRQGQTCLGTGITFSDPAVSEAIGRSADFLWIDLEHNPIGLEAMQAHLIAARAAGVAALVRVPGSEMPLIKRVLDSGAPGLIVPQVRSAAEVRAVVDACRYTPLGNRGYGPRRPANYGRIGGTAYMNASNRDLFVSVQIENTSALDELDAIVKIPHLDSLVVGPYDLSLSMGIQVTHPHLHDAIRRIVTAAHKAGLFVGIGMGASDQAFAARAVELGVNWLQVGSDYSYMVHFADNLFASIRARLQPKAD
jgi:2-keto-3-deoxy-L-rhamnonate aldolase RhmA